MVIETLHDNLIAQLRSSSSIDSVTQCATELVLNSLDAKATSIAIRVNLQTFRLQVVDNGKGISRSNLESVGIRYMTDKCHSLEDFKKHLKHYGFKGEALANIAKISQKVTITSREKDSDETFEKIFESNDSKIETAKSRASCGTTVTVEGFLEHLPVRQQCLKSNELENVKKSIESLTIIHPRVSFTLRNDLGAKLILSSAKCPDIATSFKSIHPEINENDFVLLKVSKSRISVEGLIHKELAENKRLQYVYVNKRPIISTKVQNLISTLFKKADKNDAKKHPVFVVHIKCPYADIDITLEPTKTVVFFKRFDVVKKCVEKMIKTFLGNDKVEVETKKENRAVVKDFNVSQMEGVVRGIGVKRKRDEIEDVGFIKSLKLADSPEDEAQKIEPNTTLYTINPQNEEKGKNVIMNKFISSLTNEVDEEYKKGVHVGVQTEDLSKMISKAIQTSSPILESVNDANITFLPRKLTDYECTKTDDSVFEFKHPKSVFAKPQETRKFFDFQNSKNKNFNLFEKLEEIPFCQSENSFQYAETFTSNVKFEEPSITEKCFHLSPKRLCDVQESPFFVKKVANFHRKTQVSARPKIKTNKLLTPFYKRKTWPPFRTKCERRCSCDSNSDASSGKSRKSNRKNCSEMKTSFSKNNDTNCLNNSNVSKYFVSKKTKATSNFDHSEDLFFSEKITETCPCHSESRLEISIDENEKENILNNDFKLKKMFSQEDIVEATENMWKSQQGKISIEMHSKDGIIPTTLTLKNDNIIKSQKSIPKKEIPVDVSFEMVSRYDFVPKGLSPILKDYGRPDDMSPESKEQLQNAIVESYESELLLIKWQNCIKDKNPKAFFEEIYLEKSKLIETAIPNVGKSGYAKHGLKGFENMSFTKSLFKHLEIIGQIDCKFIAALDKNLNLVLLFDQHAVHERVRLEELSQSYKNASTELDDNITMFLPDYDLSLLRDQKESLKSLGLVLNFFTNGIIILQVPLCLYNKSKKGVNISCLVESLIKEIIETLKTTDGILVNTPKVIQNIVNSEACRGAVKFGDYLTYHECVMHIRSLSNCDLPFQCAHGRPTLTPLMFLNKFSDVLVCKPQLFKLSYN